MRFDDNLLEFIKLGANGLIVEVVVHLIDFTEGLEEGFRTPCCVQGVRPLARPSG